MTGPEHYAKAERLAQVAEGDTPQLAIANAALAQVHAMLALAAATALVMGDNGSTPLRAYDEWAAVAGPEAVS